jgi:nicotinate-nucleotide adenylyltransferase
MACSRAIGIILLPRSIMHSIAIFGGTFDPVHNGHIQVSLNLQRAFGFDSYRLLPCKIPAIKALAHASVQQRIDMLRLAIAQHEVLTLDVCEIERDTPSYMVYTLENFRAEYKNAAITLVLGFDAFLTLPQWFQWEKIITLANVLIIKRGDFGDTLNIDAPLKQLLEQHETNDQNKLLCTPNGVIYFFDAGAYPIASTTIRNAIKQHINVEPLLPKAIHDYIVTHNLYR